MSSYFITGKLGSGKTLVSVGRIFEYMAQGRPVASNLDLHLENYLNPRSKKTYLRLPDKPTRFDLDSLGSGNLTPNEEKNGLLVLDELGSWFNTRAWADKSRQPLLDWFIHARKFGWDLLLIVQDIDMVDKQLRGMLGEHLVVCKRLDRLKIPFVGSLLKMFGIKAMLPKIHTARVHYGESTEDMLVDRWWYRGHDLYTAYDTKQVFTVHGNSEPTEKSFASRGLYAGITGLTYPLGDGVFSRLSPWHVKGRFLPDVLSMRDKIAKVLHEIIEPSRPIPVLRSKHPLIARIMKLPAHQRVEFFRRFDACHAF